MARPPKKNISLKEKLERMASAGLTTDISEEKEAETGNINSMDSLPERIRQILGIFKSSPAKAVNMNYFIMYDIENNKVRTLIAKYLKEKGCVRVQKSVFLANSHHRHFSEIHNTLAEINSFYENEDSIILVPVNVSDVRSMKLIGKNVQIDTLIDPPNSLFF